VTINEGPSQPIAGVAALAHVRQGDDAPATLRVAQIDRAVAAVDAASIGILDGKHGEDGVDFLAEAHLDDRRSRWDDTSYRWERCLKLRMGRNRSGSGRQTQSKTQKKDEHRP